MFFLRLRAIALSLVLFLGIVCLAGGAFLVTVARNLVNADAFAARTAQSVGDERVAAFLADRITAAVVSQQQDLIPVRAVLLPTVRAIISTDAFGVVVRRAARRIHSTVLSERGEGLLLSVPDAGILLREALGQASPALAARIPASVQDVAVGLETNREVGFVLDLWRLGYRMRSAGRILLILGVGLVALSLGFARARILALSHAGVGLIAAGTLLAACLPAGRVAAALLIKEPLVRGAMQGLWRAYMSELFGWGLFFGGLGVLMAAAAGSMLERLRSQQLVMRAFGYVGSPPANRAGRVLWGAGLCGVGVTAIMLPRELLTVAVVLAGIAVAFIGVQELFRLVMESVEPLAAEHAHARARRRQWVRPAVVIVLLAVLGSGWFLLRRPAVEPVAVSVGACNGHPELCDRRVDQVAFAGAHNAMSNAQISDWMFPHHMKGVQAMLEGGVRALLLDVHAGFPGGERIKTDIDAEKVTGDRLEKALGPEGVAAALRIRERLVGVEEDKRGLYLCHGFCELGATEFGATLEVIREFLVQRPEEVLVLVLEDYVTPPEIAAAFDATGLTEFVYQGPAEPWPTLRDMVAANRRVIVFLESGATGVPWMRPTLGTIQETPYDFKTPADFSCAPNRGGTTGSLFQINHFITTVPAPKIANAESVNARDLLLARARKCAKERGHIPNIIAVDFWQSGDLIAVVDELNGVAPAVAAVPGHPPGAVRATPAPAAR